MAAPKPARGNPEASDPFDFSTPYAPLDPPADNVSVYRLSPVVSAPPEQVMRAVQEWWDKLSPSLDRVDERLTWKLDGCTFTLWITSNNPNE